MECTIKQLRQRTKEILDLTDIGEEVIITYRGERKAKVVPLKKKKHPSSEAFGMWADREDMQDSSTYVRKLREGRYT